MFKVILSPEFGERLNLRSFTTRWVRQMEADLGTRLEWVAVEHHNTDHPHVHLAIRGVDDRGRVLTIAPEYIKSGSRERAREIATRDIGLRTSTDIRLAYERQVLQQRFTDLDRLLVKNAQNGLVSFEGPIPRRPAARDLRLAQIRRLSQLVKMGLAERTDAATWRIDPSLEQVLRLMQSSQDRQKLAAEHRQMISDPMAPIVASKLEAAGQRVSGCLVGTGMDEASNRTYLMIEGFDGKVHYLTQSKSFERARGDGLMVGDYLAIEAVRYKGKDGQERIAARVHTYGQAINNNMIDRELRSGFTAPSAPAPAGTVARAFQDAAIERSRDLTRGRTNE